MRTIIRVKRQQIFEWPAESEPAARSSQELIQISTDNVERVLDFRGPPQLSEFRTYLREGRYGLFAVVAGKVVGHAWMSMPRDVPQTLNGYFRLKAGETLIHYCHVDPELRGRGIYGTMLHRLVEFARSQPDLVRVLIDTEVSNAASIRGIEKAGFEIVACGLYVSVARVLIFRNQTTHKQIDIEN